jgi:hypothetical protein
MLFKGMDVYTENHKNTQNYWMLQYVVQIVTTGH